MVNFDIFRWNFLLSSIAENGRSAVGITLLSTFLAELLDLEITLPNIY